jgi:hypothetical protein
MNFADRYDPYPMMHKEKRRYDKALVVWRKHQLEIIHSKGGEEFAKWKKEYYDHVPSFKEFFGLEPKNIWNLRRFGEVGIAKKGPDIRLKMANPGSAVMYLGHAKDHGQEVYRLFNLETKRVVLSQDMHWLDQEVSGTMGPIG